MAEAIAKLIGAIIGIVIALTMFFGMWAAVIYMAVWIFKHV